MCMFPAQNRLAVWPGSSCLPLFPPLDKGDKGNKGSGLESPGPWPCRQCAWWNDSVALPHLSVSPHTHHWDPLGLLMCLALGTSLWQPTLPEAPFTELCPLGPSWAPLCGIHTCTKRKQRLFLREIVGAPADARAGSAQESSSGIPSTSVSLHEALQHLIAGRRPKPFRVTSPPLCQEWMHLSGQVHSIHKSLILWKFPKKGSFRVARQPLGFLTFPRDSSLPPASLSVITA